MFCDELVVLHPASKARMEVSLQGAWGLNFSQPPYNRHEAESAVRPCCALGLGVCGVLIATRLPEDAVVHPCKVNPHIQGVNCVRDILRGLTRHLPAHHCTCITGKAPACSCGHSSSGAQRSSSPA